MLLCDICLEEFKTEPMFKVSLTRRDDEIEENDDLELNEHWDMCPSCLRDFRKRVLDLARSMGKQEFTIKKKR